MIALLWSKRVSFATAKTPLSTSKWGLQPRQLLVAHQHDEMCLGQPLRVLRIEAGRTERNRKTPIVRQAFTGREGSIFSALRPFTG
jgi:hypothetical protein